VRLLSSNWREKAETEDISLFDIFGRGEGKGGSGVDKSMKWRGKKKGKRRGSFGREVFNSPLREAGEGGAPGNIRKAQDVLFLAWERFLIYVGGGGKGKAKKKRARGGKRKAYTSSGGR